MQSSIETLTEKKFVGHCMTMSFTNNKTFELWNGFMPRRKQIQNVTGTELYSVEEYPPAFFKNFNPDVLFEKWAAVEVEDFDNVPEGMKTLVVPQGLYAVFVYKGPANDGPKTYQYIFATWLPASEYEVDQRPHLAIMGEKYKNNDPASEEELWIPVRPK